MPSGRHWVHFLVVNMAFALYIAGIFYYNQVAVIKQNWPLYRCNPMYMFLADNVEQNFTYCIQNMQSGFMGHLLEPITFITSSLTAMSGNFMADIQNIRAMFAKIRTFVSSILQTVFSVFLNLIIEFQRITIGIRDLIGKTIGIMVSLMYVMDGSIKTMNSTWNGPPGQLVKALGKCFHPQTIVRLIDGTSKLMKDAKLGDVLEDGSIVEAVMQIDNRDRQPFFKIMNEKTGELIFVTGSHLVFCPEAQTFVAVKHYRKAKSCSVTYDWFCCLITDTHRIRIGSELFWDWEDHYVHKRY